MEEFNKLFKSERKPLIINKGVGPLSLLGVAFVVLKLVNVINWSWWWVLAPFWVPIALVLLLLVFLFIGLVWVINKDCKKFDKAVKEAKVNAEEAAKEEKAKDETVKETPKEQEIPVVKKSPKRNKKKADVTVLEANKSITVSNTPLTTITEDKKVNSNTEKNGVKTKRKNKKSIS